MAMNEKPVIPMPTARKWREFRVKIVPATLFCVVLACTYYVWREHVVPVSMVGRLETVQTEVASPQAGTLAQMRVARFQKVSAGDPIVDVITTDPKILAASLAVIRAEVDLLRADRAPELAGDRAAIDYEQMRMDWMKYRVELATARVSLQLAEAEFQRNEKLYEEKIVSKSEYETAQAHRDALHKEVQEKEGLVKASEQSVQKLENTTKGENSSLTAAIKVQEEKLRLTEAQMSPLTLRAPMDGSIVMVHRYNGENVGAGVPIVTISAVQSDHIIGYIRQPFYARPVKDMAVKVRTRGTSRHEGMGKILEVGPQLQPLNDAFMPPTRWNNLVELGLPVYVSMPPELKSGPGEPLKVHPGEFVDMILIPNAKM